MTALASEILERQRRITVEEYHRMMEAGILHEDERVQLLDGVLVAMTPQNSPHAWAVQQLTKLLVRALGDEFAVRPQLPLSLGRGSEPEPDVAVVVASEASSDRHPRSAVLVVEVASDSLRLDREVKGPLYARHGIPEYWIVNLVDGVLESYRDADQATGRYRIASTHRTGEVASPQSLPSVVIAVADLIG